MATWSDSNINKDIITQLTAARDDINVIAKEELQNIRLEAVKAAEASYDNAAVKLDGVIRQQAKEIQDLRESMLELVENAECKAEAENKVIEQYNDCMFEWQAKLIKRLNTAVISCAIAIVGVIIHEIIK